jgi:hypothetical protein
MASRLLLLLLFSLLIFCGRGERGRKGGREGEREGWKEKDLGLGGGRESSWLEDPLWTSSWNLRSEKKGPSLSLSHTHTHTPCFSSHFFFLSLSFSSSSSFLLGGLGIEDAWNNGFTGHGSHSFLSSFSLSLCFSSFSLVGI